MAIVVAMVEVVGMAKVMALLLLVPVLTSRLPAMVLRCLHKAEDEDEVKHRPEVKLLLLLLFETSKLLVTTTQLRLKLITNRNDVRKSKLLLTMQKLRLAMLVRRRREKELRKTLFRS